MIDLRLVSSALRREWRMRLTTVPLILVAASTSFRPSPQSQPTSVQPAILGNLVQGTYSNTVLGVKFELPADWQIDNLDESEDLSRHFPRRMHLRFKSNEDWIILSASPIEPDEKLQHVFRISLMGAKDGGVASTRSASKRKKSGTGTKCLAKN